MGVYALVPQVRHGGGREAHSLCFLGTEFNVEWKDHKLCLLKDQGGRGRAQGQCTGPLALRRQV